MCKAGSDGSQHGSTARYCTVLSCEQQGNFFSNWQATLNISLRTTHCGVRSDERL